MVRTFLAIDLSDEAKDYLKTLQHTIKRCVKADIRWVSTNLMHITLCFLGSIPEEQLKQVSEVSDIITHDTEQFSLQIKGVGSFPNFTKPRVIWAGISGDIERLHGIKSDLDRLLHDSIGFQPDDRRFSPHLTLGRVKSGRNISRLSKCLVELTKEDLNGPSLKARELVVYKSVLSPKGPTYTRISAHQFS